jgi:heme/copper-type cytochrome/quinol oxidase subunit 2
MNRLTLLNKKGWEPDWWNAMNELLSAWAGVVIVMGTAVLVALVAMVWILFFRKNAQRRRRRRHHHGDRRQPYPTLAQIGGLPPARQDDKFSEEQPTPTLISRS